MMFLQDVEMSCVYCIGPKSTQKLLQTYLQSLDGDIYIFVSVHDHRRLQIKDSRCD